MSLQGGQLGGQRGQGVRGVLRNVAAVLQEVVQRHCVLLGQAVVHLYPHFKKKTERCW